MNPEPPRTRQHGTNVFRCADYPSVITAARHVLEHGYAKVNGVALDSTTAGMLVAVNDALNEKNLGNITAKFTQWVNFLTGKGKPLAQAQRRAFTTLVHFFWAFAK